jgi:hypothetical protein
MGLHIGEGLETTVSGTQLGRRDPHVPGARLLEALTIFTETGDASVNLRAVQQCASRYGLPPAARF